LARIGVAVAGHGVIGGVAGVAGAGGFSSHAARDATWFRKLTAQFGRVRAGRRVHSWVCGEMRVRECMGVRWRWLAGQLGHSGMRNDDKHGETPSETWLGGHQADLATKKGGTLGAFVWRMR
jgi:hypothetical protein